MNLIPWADREAARSADMDLLVTGAQRDTKWVDFVFIEGRICKLVVEVFCKEVQAPQVYDQCFVRPIEQQQLLQEYYQYHLQQQQQQQQQQQKRQPSTKELLRQFVQKRNQAAQAQLHLANFQLGQDIGAAFFQ